MVYCNNIVEDVSRDFCYREFNDDALRNKLSSRIKVIIIRVSFY